MEQIYPFRRQAGQHSPMRRLHHHNRDALLSEDFILFPGCPMEPVVIIQLNLHEIPGISFQKLTQGVRGAVKGKAEIPDSSETLLLKEIFGSSMIQIVGNQPVRDAVQQIKINPFHLKPAQLFGKLGSVVRIGLHVEFVRHKIVLPGIFFQCLSEKGFGLAAVVNIGRIEIIDAMLDAEIDDLLRPRLVDGLREAFLRLRKPHRAHPERRQADAVFKVLFLHSGFLLFLFHPGFLLVIRTVFISITLK